MANFYQNKSEQVCSNCGESGHTFRYCIEPVSSYGVLVFRWISRNEMWPQEDEFCKDTVNPTGTTSLIPQILMIQRKDSLGFMDIMRGKYKVNDPDYIRKQLRGMTQDERKKLETMEFEDIWHQLWGSDAESSQRYAHDRIISKQKLAELRAGIRLPSGDTYTLLDLLRQEPALYKTPEWGFPKGRRDPHETDIKCAFRELEEETSILESELLKVTNICPFIEQFYGSNNIHYRHTYYIAQYIGSRNISFDALNPEMAREIGNLAWKSLDEAIVLLRPENVEKRGILVQLANLLRNYSPVMNTNLVSLSIPKASPMASPMPKASLELSNENTSEEQQGYYVFTNQSDIPVPGKVENSRRLFGARSTVGRIPDIYRSNPSGGERSGKSNN
jgi:8-oxo-dGTP pyrophosphatase MutT (NUDIX family)